MNEIEWVEIPEAMADLKRMVKDAIELDRFVFQVSSDTLATLLSYITALEAVAQTARVDRDDICVPNMPDCIKACEIGATCKRLMNLDGIL
jgi:hypothetical protein